MDGENQESIETSSASTNEVKPKMVIKPQSNLLGNSLKADDPTKTVERLASGNPEIVARTFAEAKARPKGFSDEFIIGVLTRTLKSPDGTNPRHVELYLNQAMPDQSEFELSHSPEGLADMHRRWKRNIKVLFNFQKTTLSRKVKGG